MKELLLVINKKDKEILGTVRAHEQIRLAESAEWLWLRCPLTEEALPAAEAMRQLPAHTAYILQEENKLFPRGGKTPVALLQEMKWVPIRKFLSLELPVAAMPGRVEQKCTIELVASDRREEGRALLTSMEHWSTYAEIAPEIRLRQLRFAVSENSSVLIMGTPLPPVPGQEYWLQEGNLLPAGYDFRFSIAAPLIAARLNPQHKHLLLFYPDGNWEAIPSEAFVPATRSGVRLTQEGLTHG